MDLNYVLEWLVGISAGASLLVHGARFRFRFRGWILVFLLILAVFAAGKHLAPESAGYIAASVWFLFFMLPALGHRWLGRLLMRQRYDSARRLARVLVVLHPLDGWRNQPAYLTILSQMQKGDLDGARRRLPDLQDKDVGLARFVKVHLMRAEGDWLGLRAWVEDQPNRAELMRDPHTAVLYVRALGETGNVDAMLSEFARLVATPIGLASRPTLHLYVAALAGRPGVVEQLFNTSLRSATPVVQRYWLATALQAAGQEERARKTLEELLQSDELALRAGVEHRLNRPLAVCDFDALAEGSRATLESIISSVDHEHRYGLSATPTRRATPVTWGLLAINVGVFLLEVPGGSENRENLVELGALVVGAEGYGGWWRIFSAGFLHFGVLHLTLNAVGIWFLGRYTERVWGRWTLLSCYLGATFGANAVALVLLEVLYDVPAFAVGASGGVMGILGAALAFAFIEWIRTRARLLIRHVSMFVVILGLQIVFDVMTPNVSSVIHLGGLGIGVLLGVVLALQKKRDQAGSIVSPPK